MFKITTGRFMRGRSPHVMFEGTQKNAHTQAKRRICAKKSKQSKGHFYKLILRDFFQNVEFIEVPLSHFART